MPKHLSIPFHSTPLYSIPIYPTPLYSTPFHSNLPRPTPPHLYSIFVVDWGLEKTWTWTEPFWHLLGHLFGQYGERIGLEVPGNYSASFWSNTKKLKRTFSGLRFLEPWEPLYLRPLLGPFWMVLTFWLKNVFLTLSFSIGCNALPAPMLDRVQFMG